MPSLCLRNEPLGCFGFHISRCIGDGARGSRRLPRLSFKLTLTVDRRPCCMWRQGLRFEYVMRTMTFAEQRGTGDPGGSDAR